MKLMPSLQPYTRGRYEITIDGGCPGAIEFRDVDGNIHARIFAVSPKLTGSIGGLTGISSANAFIMEKDCVIYGKALQNKARENLAYSQLINLIWNFCIENELEISPIEFDLIGFVNLWFIK